MLLSAEVAESGNASACRAEDRGFKSHPQLFGDYMKVPIRLFNTMGRKKQAFKPLKGSTVRMYSCGPTVYDYAHIGHFRAYVFVDVLRRVLEFNNFKVDHVMNITDVGHLTSDADAGDDKMEKAAKEKKMSAWEIAEYYTKDFFDAMKKLNVKTPGKVCKATDHIEDMISFIKKIEKNGYTYRTSDGIYFDTSKLEDYGKLSGLDKKKAEKLKAGARTDFGEKKNVTDFALWKFSPEGERRQMEWESPWGKGFPGWHIECSVMSTKYLGEQFDIHTGGIDHIPIHHSNEIAQSEAANGKEPVRFWMHNEFVLIDGGKMSKSLKNFYNMADIEAKGITPLALRYLFLTAHYRSKINFTWESLKAAEQALDKLNEKLDEFKEADVGKFPDGRAEEYVESFLKCVNDDLNTTKAISLVWKLVRDKQVSNADKRSLLLDFDKVFGLELGSAKKTKIALDEKEKIDEMVELRKNMRKSGKYQEADEIRKRLDKEFGVLIEDTENGTRWKRK